MDSSPINFERLNKALSALSSQMATELKQEYALVVANPSAGGIAGRLRAKNRKRFGVMDSIGANFARHGIYVEKGAGKGHGGTVGSTWKTEGGEYRRTKASSMGKMNTGNRTANVWLAPVLDKYQKYVADVTAKHAADMAIDAVMSMVPPTTKTKF